MKKIELRLVSTDNNNKFYRMEQTGDDFVATYGRIDSTSASRTYPMSKWNTKYREKIKKGYTDVTDYLIENTAATLTFNDSGVEQLYQCISKYTNDLISANYTISIGAVTQAMIDDAQDIINKLSSNPSNDLLIKLFTILPRRMSNVNNYLLGKNIEDTIVREQGLLDSVSSGVVSHSNKDGQDFNSLFNVDMVEIPVPDKIRSLFNGTNNTRYKIHKCFKVIDHSRQTRYNNFLEKQSNKSTELLIHGTRNPNVFKILKSGLILRPTNVYISGAAYGHGIYHSAHTAKSIGYTGRQTDAIFFLQEVHMGNHYTYNGWYRNGKDISRSQMSYEGLNKLGYDSLYVKPGDGLLNSEYIVYKEEQTVTKYLLWLK